MIKANTPERFRDFATDSELAAAIKEHCSVALPFAAVQRLLVGNFQDAGAALGIAKQWALQHGATADAMQASGPWIIFTREEL